MKLRLQNLERIYKQFIMLFVDALTILFALWLAFVLRIGEPFPTEYIYPSWWIFIAVPIIMIPLFIKLGLYRAVLQYIGIKVITTTFQATTIACLIIGYGKTYSIGYSPCAPRSARSGRTLKFA